MKIVDLIESIEFIFLFIIFLNFEESAFILIIAKIFF
jgi:hypothetical protein